MCDDDAHLSHRGRTVGVCVCVVVCVILAIRWFVFDRMDVVSVCSPSPNKKRGVRCMPFSMQHQYTHLRPISSAFVAVVEILFRITKSSPVFVDSCANSHLVVLDQIVKIYNDHEWTLCPFDRSNRRLP